MSHVVRLQLFLSEIGGEQAHLGGDLENGYYVKPTVFTGHNKMRIFQEEIFGPVLSVTRFKNLEDAIGSKAGFGYRKLETQLPEKKPNYRQTATPSKAKPQENG